MSEPSSSDPLLVELDPLYRRLAEAGESARNWSREQLDWTPDEKSWSIAQVLEHVRLTVGVYVKNIRFALAHASPGQGPWKPTFVGKMFGAMLQSKRRFSAPSAFVPDSPCEGDIVEAYLGVHRTLCELMEQADRESVLRWKLKTPIPLLNVNLGDGFRMMALHGLRHLSQIERIRTSPGFPEQAAAAGG